MVKSKKTLKTSKTSSVKTTKKTTESKKKPVKTTKTLKASKSKKTKVKAVTAVVEAPVVEAPVVEAPVVVAPVEKKVETMLPEETVDDTRLKELENRMNSLVASLQTLRTEAQNIVVITRSLKTDVTKMVKGLVKDKKKFQKKKRSKPRAPSGFAKPTYISANLCTFLGVPTDSMFARTEVTRKVNAYIKEHDLQNPANKKEIMADSELLKILVVEKDIPLTYFNLQKAIKGCFSSTPFETVV